MALNTIEEIIEDLRAGKMVILMDDEDRENEGDLIMAADAVTPEAINFMATYGRGLVCLTLTEARCKQLNLPLMVDNNSAQFSTNFTVSIEAAQGVTTGISAADRAVTVQAAVAKDATAADIVMPGHIFPLKAQEGGVLTRAGHTEAGCDLARLAGYSPAGVIVEILNEDGTMARRPDLEVFAEKHDLKLGTVADLIEYRNNNETTIERVAECKLPTAYGEFDLITYQDTIDNQAHFALVKGDVSDSEPTLVRVHLQSVLGDLLLSDRQASQTWPIAKAMEKIADEGGILVVLGNEESSAQLIDKMKQFQAEDCGEATPGIKPQGASRRVGVGSQILADLGVKDMRLLSSPKKYHALSGFGLNVVEYISE
ncbi:bifunctional 3,4-dihydroxy-2-butanone-4-phosphate synthase/GTP cyclohydrolase II [Motilimonas pumila]|uniref:bifunctional 3,4-dihydroxy-2-butanone-4-phosphate synthase/GTP cyclohydrolase II n=1 Tax=Motilimonas pumila TaxID=2303987 RepID=UPI0018E0A474|nr:bifunctional 3,4-dihydroxy-2-butanone-4-phosphate synthase/GTP cyclohydrolase II [Motilimonas pumila]